jgi:molybdopterin/thiamine biosynthesis adenylyltransferase
VSLTIVFKLSQDKYLPGMSKKTVLDPSELYSRQTVIKEVGEEGQNRLMSSRVAVVGIGGLGSASSMYLALAGVGFLRLIDQDTVEAHNLHRQSLFSVDDLRRPKAEAAADRIRSIAPRVMVEPVAENLRDSNVDKLLQDVDVIVDGLDNMMTRYIVNSASVKMRKPYVYGAAIAMEGDVSVFKPPETPCLRCITPGVEDAMLPTCETRGILGPVAGAIGAIQAVETIKLLAGIEGVLKGRLLTCDFKNVDFYTIQIAKRPDCEACGSGAWCKGETERLTWLCGSNTVNVNPSEPMSIDLTRAANTLSTRFKVLVRSPMVLVVQLEDGVEVSVFQQGRMLIKNVDSEDKALKVYERLVALVSR